MTMRSDGRRPDQLRPVSVQMGFLDTAEGSCWIEFGKTKVLCSASFQDTVPNWLGSSEGGWVTAEYAMLPKSSKTRIPRESSRPRGRTAEIQRLIGRSLRAIVDTKGLGPRTVTIDCDVIQADGGTRTAAVTGGFLAFWEACRLMASAGALPSWPIREKIAAISVGRSGGVDLLDLCYGEDSTADVDMNVVMTESGRFVEIQGTAESRPFSRLELDSLLALAEGGLQELFRIEDRVLAEMPPPN